MAIKFQRDVESRAIETIKRYFEAHLDQEIGDLKAGLLLEFFLAELGPSVYNKAIADAQKHLQESVMDLDGTCYEPEFAYWKR
jgi:uncharacterized protein (DUF2164 family)